jgi:predicted SAM-dependent methyltransferase
MNDADALEAAEKIGESPSSVMGLAKFETRSLLGRLLRWDAAPAGDGSPRLLHLGCGNIHLPGFVNADFFAFKAAALKPDWMLDLRFPLRCPDNCWDGAFSEHTFEHLHPSEVDRLLKDLLRALKPGAWLRISVPDLQKYVDYYCGRPVHENFKKYYRDGNLAMRTISQRHYHFSLWDAPTMIAAMERAGFTQVSEASFGVGADPRLLKDTAARQWESLYVEGQKPGAAM